MSENQQKDTISRRKALTILAGSVGATLSRPILSRASVSEAMEGKGLESTTPSAPYVPKFFGRQEMRSLEALSETIIPTDSHSPGAQAARVNEYIDQIVSAATEAHKEFWRDGLAAVDKMARDNHGKEFSDCTPEQQRGLVQTISEHEDHPVTPEERLFVAMKRATVDGYYTSDVGIHQELDYQGNTYLSEFAGCKHEEHKT